MVPFHEIGIVAIAAAVTMALRFLPFFVFRGDRPMPEGLRYLAGVLPCAMIGMLVIYCLRNTDVFAMPHGLPEIVSCLLVAVLHLWKRNTLISIAAGTAFYMFLVQAVF